MSLKELKLRLVHGRPATDAHRIDAALQDLAREGILETTMWGDAVRLTHSGRNWLGEDMTHSEGDTHFLIALLAATEHGDAPDHLAGNGFIATRYIYALNEWPYDEHAAGARVARLSQRGWVTVPEDGSTAACRVTPAGLEVVRATRNR